MDVGKRHIKGPQAKHTNDQHIDALTVRRVFFMRPHGLYSSTHFRFFGAGCALGLRAWCTEVHRVGIPSCRNWSVSLRVSGCAGDGGFVFGAAAFGEHGEGDGRFGGSGEPGVVIDGADE